MATNDSGPNPPADTPQRAVAFNLGFFRSSLCHILRAAGFAPTLGWPRARTPILVWGARNTAKRGHWVARKTQSPVVYVEDAFLRSLFPGRMGEAPLGLLIDHKAPHFDCSRASDLEDILNTIPPLTTAQQGEAQALIQRLRDMQLAKYSAVPDTPQPLPRNAVLVIDQVRGDASIAPSGATAATFQTMLSTAIAENPGCPVFIKPHPETLHGLRPGHFDPTALPPGVTWLQTPLSPAAACAMAPRVYTVSSQFGFEAMLHGLRPRVFAGPFYAGWGLSDDAMDFPRRKRALSMAELFTGAMITYPKWYDPYRQQLTTLCHVMDQLAAELKAWRDDHRGWRAHNIRLWKRKHFQAIFGRFAPVRFTNAPPKGAKHMRWGYGPEPVTTVEDGFLRSNGLGAALVPPLSLVLDDIGIYFNATAPSRLEALITHRATTLPPDARARAGRLRDMICQNGLSKYNLAGGALPNIPANRHVILVPGQVADDASITLGTDTFRTNTDLLAQTRAQNPDAFIIYKPHPDVVAGLRPGAVVNAHDFADHVITTGDAMHLLPHVNAVWTLTSLLGFEALLRGVPVTCLGLPFYAGWGLTRDYTPCPRRNARPCLDALVHATLIDYPRYFNPITQRPCPPEVVVHRLAR